MPTIDLPQGAIRFSEQGTGRPVLCVHGYLMGEELWADFAAALAPKGFRVITPTWPLGAHRDPVRGDHDRGPLGVAATIADFIEALDLDDVVLVGNDSGGAISQVVATTRPERLGALVLTNCDAFDRFPPPPFTVLRPIARAGLLPTVIRTMRFGLVWRSPLGFGLLSHADLGELVPAWAAVPRQDRQVMADLVDLTLAIEPSITRRAADGLADLDLPTLVAWAPDDRLFPLADGERLAEVIPDAELVLIADSRTLSMVDQPDRLADLVAKFATT